MTSQFEKVLDEINHLDLQMYDLKKSIHKQISEVTERYLIALRKEKPNAVGVYGSFTIDEDDWDISPTAGIIDIRIYGGYGDADEYSIPIKYFTDEETLVAYEEHCQQVKDEHDEQQRKREIESDREAFERLKAKLGE